MPSVEMVDNERILTVVIIIAVLAVAARIVINRHQRGGVNWFKLGSIVALGAAFLATFLSVDPYRMETAVLGSVGKDNLADEHVIGRPAESDAVPRIASIANGVVPMHFTLVADSVVPTKYWMSRGGESDKDITREHLVSESDTSRNAIRRVTRGFGITTRPADEDDYLRISVLYLADGERALAVLPDYDVRPGSTNVLTAKVLEGKMLSIAKDCGAQDANVYLLGYDVEHHKAAQATLLLYRAMAAILAAILAGGAIYAVRFLVSKK